VAGRSQDLQAHLAQGQALPVVQRLDSEADVGTRAVGDDRTDLVGKL
jgi:hypothetical protein